MADVAMNKQFTSADIGRCLGIIGFVNALALLPVHAAEQENAEKKNQSEQSTSADGQPVSKGKTVRIRVASTNNQGKSMKHNDITRKDLSSGGTPTTQTTDPLTGRTRLIVGDDQGIANTGTNKKKNLT